MANAVLTASVISKRLRLLSELDASAGVSFMKRAEFRLRVFGVVDCLERGLITPEAASERFDAIHDDVAALVAAMEATL